MDRISANADEPDNEFLEYLARIDGIHELGQSETNISAAATAGFALTPA